MSIGIGVDFGPGRGHHAAIGLDPWNPERLVIRKRLQPGCLMLVAVPMGFCLYAGVGEQSPWIGVAGAAICGLLLFGRHWRIVDRERKVLEEGAGVLFPLWRKARPLDGFRSVAVFQEETTHRRKSGHTTVTTTVRVALEGRDGLLPLVTAGVWEEAIPAAEMVAHFLELPIDDRCQQVRRPAEKLDLPLIQNLTGARALRLGEGLGKLVTVGDDGEALLLGIDRPRQHQYLFLTLPVLILWTLPVSLLGGEPIFGLLPVLILLGSWLKVAYGYSSRVKVSGEGLEVRSRGLVFGRTVKFPLEELEELARLRPERGGPRNAIADAFDGFLVARSDRAAARFGHGLSWEELERLRAAIVAKIEALGRRLAPAGGREPFVIPELYRPVLPVLALATGALVGNLAPRPLGICVDLPFLEHVLNLGGLLGLLAGMILERKPLFSRSGKLRAAFVLFLMAACLLAALRPRDPPFQARPHWDEWVLLQSTGSVKSWRFLLGWFPAGLALAAAADLLLFSLIALAIRGPRFLRKGRPVSGIPRRTRLGRQALAGSLALLCIAGVGLLASYADGLLRKNRLCCHHHHHHHHDHRPSLGPRAATAAEATAREAAPFTGELEAREPGRLRVEAEDHGPIDLRIPPMKLEEDRKPMLEIVPRGIPVEVIRVRHQDFQTFFFGSVLSQAQFLEVKVEGDALWVATERGLLRFSPREPVATLYGEESGIPGVRVTSLEVLHGRVVADLSRPTTPGCALGLGGWIFDPAALSWSPLRQPSQWGYHRDGADLWIAADRAVRLHLWTEEAAVYTSRDGLLHESVSAIATVGREVWFAMFGSYQRASKSFAGGGVSCLDLETGRWKSFTEKNGLAYGYSCGVAADGQEVWVVHWDGSRGTSVYHRETGKWTILRQSAEGIPLGGVVVALDEEAAWLGQQGGLVRLDRSSGKAKLYREADGLPGYLLSGVVVADDAVWASAYSYGGAGKVRSAGLVRFPRAAEKEQ